MIYLISINALLKRVGQDVLRARTYSPYDQISAQAETGSEKPATSKHKETVAEKPALYAHRNNYGKHRSVRKQRQTPKDPEVCTTIQYRDISPRHQYLVRLQKKVAEKPVASAEKLYQGVERPDGR
jgi:hypothetical protein